MFTNPAISEISYKVCVIRGSIWRLEKRFVVQLKQIISIHRCTNLKHCYIAAETAVVQEKNFFRYSEHHMLIFPFHERTFNSCKNCS